MVEAFFNAAQVVDQEGRAHLAAAAPGQFLFDHIQQHAAHGFQELQQHVAGEAVAHHHVELAREDVAPFAVAGEGEALLCCQQGVGAQAELVALALLFADIHQADAGLGHLQDIAAVDVSKQRPLVQVGGLAIHVGAHIEHQYLLFCVFGGE